MEVRFSTGNKWENPRDKWCCPYRERTPGSVENVNRIGLQVHIQADFAVAAYAGFLSKHFVNGFHQINCSTQALARGIRHLGVQQRMGHGVKRGADGQSAVVVGLLGHKVASGGGVVTANEAVCQLLLLRAQRGIGFAKLRGSCRAMVSMFLYVSGNLHGKVPTKDLAASSVMRGFGLISFPQRVVAHSLAR